MAANSFNLLGVGEGSVLSYTDATRGPAPIPASELALPTVWAEPYFKVSDGAVALEGPAFDRRNNLYFVDVYGGRVLLLTPDRQLSTFYVDPALHPAGIAIHADGRIFVAAVGDFRNGSVIVLDPRGGEPQHALPPVAGYVADDLVLAADGGFYFTDFKGTTSHPTGGVYHVSADFRTVTPIIPNMSGANGVSLGLNDKVLWATEFNAGRLHRVDLADPVTPARFGTSTPYHFAGRSPDSMRTDADGNVYVAMYYQGRILVFNPSGIPIGQILLPGREKGQFLRSTSLAFVPGSREVVIVSRDDNGAGSMIFKAGAFAPGIVLHSHR